MKKNIAKYLKKRQTLNSSIRLLESVKVSKERRFKSNEERIRNLQTENKTISNSLLKNKDRLTKLNKELKEVEKELKQ